MTVEQSGAGGGAAWLAAPATEKMAKMERRIRVAVIFCLGWGVNEVVFLVGKGCGDGNGNESVGDTTVFM